MISNIYRGFKLKRVFWLIVGLLLVTIKAARDRSFTLAGQQ